MLRGNRDSPHRDDGARGRAGCPTAGRLPKLCIPNEKVWRSRPVRRRDRPRPALSPARPWPHADEFEQGRRDAAVGVLCPIDYLDRLGRHVTRLRDPPSSYMIWPFHSVGDDEIWRLPGFPRWDHVVAHLKWSRRKERCHASLNRRGGDVSASVIMPSPQQRRASAQVGRRRLLMLLRRPPFYPGNIRVESNIERCFCVGGGVLAVAEAPWEYWPRTCADGGAQNRPGRPPAPCRLRMGRGRRYESRAGRPRPVVGIGAVPQARDQRWDVPQLAYEYGGMGVSDARKLKMVEEKNRKLKKLMWEGQTMLH